jgi:hypothetical protein
MKIIVLNKEEFASKKDGTSYVKCSSFNEVGEYIEIFTTKARYDAFGFDKVLSKSEVKEFFDKYESGDVQFDNKGRIVSLS